MTGAVKIPVVIGRNRLRGKGEGAMVDCRITDEPMQRLHDTLRAEAKRAGVAPTAEWLGRSTGQLLRMFEAAQAAWESSKGDTIGHVFEGCLPSGRTLLIGEERVLARLPVVGT